MYYVMIYQLLTDPWGARIYVTWFTLSNFIAPLVALSFYYVKICSKIRRNLRAKKRMLPANTTANPLVKLSTGSNSTMELSSALPDFANSFRPRAHSLEGISRAKIKSVKQTIVVITSYVIFSAPAVIVQLWRAWIQGQNQLGKLSSIFTVQGNLRFFQYIYVCRYIFNKTFY